MPLIYEKLFTPEICQNNSDKIYVFADNKIRKGKKGQAIIRDEINSLGFITKRMPSMKPEAFYKDEDMAEYQNDIFDDCLKIYKFLKEGKTVVFPFYSWGTGLAQMPKRCPKIMKFIDDLIYCFDENFNRNNIV